jgi:hypothetical protein
MNEIIKNTCKIGQGEKCCKYLVVGTGGFECMKLHNKEFIDRQWAKTQHVAQGDNCEGKEQSELNME